MWPQKRFFNCVDCYCLVKAFKFWHNVGAKVADVHTFHILVGVNVTFFVFAHVLTQVLWCGACHQTDNLQNNLFTLQIWLTFLEDCNSLKQMQNLSPQTRPQLTSCKSASGHRGRLCTHLSSRLARLSHKVFLTTVFTSSGSSSAPQCP